MSNNEWFGSFDTPKALLNQILYLKKSSFIFINFCKNCSCYILVIFAIILPVIGHLDGELQWLIFTIPTERCIIGRGASQRVQEDTKFARIMEGLELNF